MKQLNLITHSRKKTALFVFQSYLRKIMWLLHNFKEFFDNSYMGGVCVFRVFVVFFCKLLIEAICPNSSQYMKLKCS